MRSDDGTARDDLLRRATQVHYESVRLMVSAHAALAEVRASLGLPPLYAPHHGASTWAEMVQAYAARELESGRSVRDVAHDLGVTVAAVYQWRYRAKAREGGSDGK